MKQLFLLIVSLAALPAFTSGAASSQSLQLTEIAIENIKHMQRNSPRRRHHVVAIVPSTTRWEYCAYATGCILLCGCMAIIGYGIFRG